MLGLRVKVAVLGGSVSLVTRETAAYDAGWVAFLHKWLELAFTPCGDEYAWPRECAWGGAPCLLHPAGSC
jgi:hypothetical protein